MPLGIRPDRRGKEARIPGEVLAAIVEEAHATEHECFSRARHDLAPGTLIVDGYTARENGERRHHAGHPPREHRRAYILSPGTHRCHSTPVRSVGWKTIPREASVRPSEHVRYE